MSQGFLQLLLPAPAVPRIDDAAVRREYPRWRRRILVASLIGYAVFYIVRKNLPVAMPALQKALGASKADLGIFLTLHGVLYGVSKFANGFLGDRTNPRWFMALGLICAAAMNVGAGLSASAAAFGAFWLLNGWFQGMGFPPCARSLTQWFSASERGTKFSIWNTSHNIGGAAAVLLGSFLVTYDWRLCFFVPAGIAGLTALCLVDRLRDSPTSLGLPSIEEHSGVREAAAAGTEAVGDDPADLRRFTVRQVFRNPWIWVVSLANFFVYTIRYAVLDWGPTLLTETKGLTLNNAGWTVAAYELSGIAGMLATGWISDRLCAGRAGRVCAFAMGLCTLCVGLLWLLPARSPLVYTAVYCAAGFSIYGPQCLVGVLAANLATRRAAATAIGLTGLFGYLSTALSGWGLGYVADHYGWEPVFKILVGAGVAAAVLFACCWNAGAAARPAAAGEATT